MEPSTTTGRKGSLDNPEVREDVPGHVIPILEREFDDFDNEAEKFLAGEHARERVHRLPAQAGGLRPAPGRRPDDAGSSCPGAASRPSRWRCSPTSSSGGRRSTRATSRRARTSRSITSRCATCRGADPRDLRRPACRAREGCGNTVRNVTADPWAGVCHDELWDPTPYVGAYVRYFVRHPTTQLMPRKVKTAFTGLRHRPRADRHPRHRVHRPRARRREGLRDPRRRRHVDHAADRADARRLRDRRGRRVPQVGRGRLPHLRPPGLAAREPRAGPHQGARRQGRHRGGARAWSTRSCKGDWVAERDFSIDHRLFVHDEEANAPAPPLAYGSPNGDGSEFARFREANVESPAPGRLLGRPGQGGPRRPDPGAVPRARRDHARLLRRLRPHHRAPEPAAALGPRRGRLRRLAAA